MTTTSARDEDPRSMVVVTTSQHEGENRFPRQEEAQRGSGGRGGSSTANGASSSAMRIGTTASNSMILPDDDKRFVERMRRRTSVRLDNPDAIAEARRAGTYVADRILQRTAAATSSSWRVGAASAASASSAAAPPPSLSSSTRQLMARGLGDSRSGGLSPASSSFRASTDAPLFHSAIVSSSAAPPLSFRGRAGSGSAAAAAASSSSVSGGGAGGNGAILDSRRGSYLLNSGNHHNDGGFPRLSENYLLATIPSFDLSVESSRNPQPSNHDDDDDDDYHESGVDDNNNDHAARASLPVPYSTSTTTTAAGRHVFSRQSSERAVRRGSRRGIREANERDRAASSSLAASAALDAASPSTRHHGGGHGDDEWSAYSDVDLTTITDAFTDFTTKESVRRRRTQQQAQQQPEKERSAKKKRGKWVSSKPKWLSRPRGRKGSSSYSKSDGGDPDYDVYRAATDGEESPDEDAWMCGVCGQVFPSLEVAERHEDNHLRKVIQQLGWNAAASPGRGGMLPPTTVTAMAATSSSPATGTIAADEAAQTAALHANDALRQLGFFGPHRASAPGGAGGRRPRFDSSDSIPNLRSGTGLGSGNPLAPLHAGDRFYSVRHSRSDEERVEEAFGNSKTAARAELGGGLEGARQPSGPPKPPPMNRLVSAGQYRSDLAEDTLIPTKRRPRTASGSEVRFDEANVGTLADPSLMPPVPTPVPNSTRIAGGDAMPSLLMSDTMQNYVVLADEALLNVCWRATPLILAPNEVQAERHLAYLGKDKAYYDDIVARAQARRTNPSNRYRSDATDTLRGKVQNKLLDAYQLMKEGDGNLARKDVYNCKHHEDGTGGENSMITHTTSTMYVNVLVRNSVQVVKYELERLAREKWEHPDEGKEKYTRFELFRVYAHVNFVKLAGLALASDFTPRRIAIQLSNDIYRLLTPRLKRRGVTISTEIEYRVGGYFVLAVNINTVDWARLIKTSNRDLNARKTKWRKESANKQHDDGSDEHRMGRLSALMSFLATMHRRLMSLSKYDLIDHILAWMYYLHWFVYLPICVLAYKTPGIGSTVRKFIISSAIDEICYYVHERGMEMEIRVLKAEYQASFMLSALREIRADGRELKKKRQETEAQEVGTILGPLLGPKIKDDDGPSIEPPGFELPANLDFVGLEVDLPVGFRRLRWAYLSRKSTFITEALWKAESKYENITISDWTKHSDFIGDPNPPPTVIAEDFLGAEFEASYLMPKSAFVSANMSYATSQLIAYNDYCFCVKTRSRNPDAPFGSTFVAWTQVLVINAGHNCCKLICSVEAEFPNGPPMVARQIQSGMRAGTGESFVLMGETISKYANAFP